MNTGMTYIGASPTRFLTLAVVAQLLSADPRHVLFAMIQPSALEKTEYADVGEGGAAILIPRSELPRIQKWLGRPDVQKMIAQSEARSQRAAEKA
ncbi:MAG: hypothetical protein ACR2NX_00355 [Chthoniobacterales bacterium]